MIEGAAALLDRLLDDAEQNSAAGPRTQKLVEEWRDLQTLIDAAAAELRTAHVDVWTVPLIARRTGNTASYVRRLKKGAKVLPLNLDPQQPLYSDNDVRRMLGEKRGSCGRPRRRIATPAPWVDPTASPHAD